MHRPSAPLRFALAFAITVLAPIVLHAQQPAASDTTFRRGHRLVSQGQGDAGRALIDSVLGVTPQGSPAYAEGLFWRAVTATRSADAERDYLRIVIEYPLSPRAEDALIRLAELEMMRGDRVRAQRHLQRLIIEHPTGPSRARASYWLARVFFDGNDLPRACNELNVARAKAAPGDVELRNQVDYQSQRCVGVAVVQPVPQAPAPSTMTAPGAGTVAGTTPTTPPPAPTGTPTAGSASGIASGRGSVPTQSPATPPVTGQTPPASGSPPTTTTVSPPPPPVTGATTPAPVASTAQTPRPAPAGTARSTPGFSVQVAAFPTQAAADTFRETLAAKGYDVRVWGTAAPFRVRVGRFATRAEATALAQELRAKMIAKDAWVVEAEVR